jgi:hypothetical protein
MRIVFGPLSSPSASRGRFFYGVGFASKRFSGRAHRAIRIFRSALGFFRRLEALFSYYFDTGPSSARWCGWFYQVRTSFWA